MKNRRRREIRYAGALVRSLFTAVPLAVLMSALSAFVVVRPGRGTNESVRLIALLSLGNLAAALIGSLIAAAMVPLWRHRLGRLVVGAAIGLVVVPLLSIPMFGNPMGWVASEWLAAFTTGLLIGGVVGVAFSGSKG